jgi:hypothetical protein
MQHVRSGNNKVSQYSHFFQIKIAWRDGAWLAAGHGCCYEYALLFCLSSRHGSGRGTAQTRGPHSTAQLDALHGRPRNARNRLGDTTFVNLIIRLVFYPKPQATLAEGLLPSSRPVISCHELQSDLLVPGISCRASSIFRYTVLYAAELHGQGPNPVSGRSVFAAHLSKAVPSMITA